MSGEPFVVVGGDAAGLSAASKCKREAPDREVVVFEQGDWVSYAHCGMPYYVKGEVESLSALLSLSPEEITDRGIDLRRRHEVRAVDPDAGEVVVDGPDGEFTQPYGDLLIATGGHATTDPIAGSNLAAAYTMHSMDSAAAVRAALTPPEDPVPGIDVPYVDSAAVDRAHERAVPESVAIVGGGYVGVEMAEAFTAHDLDVRLFQRSDRLLPPFGEAVGETVAAELRDRGVDLHLDAAVRELAGAGRVEHVETETGTFDADLALVGIGIQPNTDLVADTDIALGDSGAIATDEFGRTNREDVYAAGDCAEARHTVTDEPTWVPLGLTANRAGRAVGTTVAGEPSLVGAIAATAVLKAFDLECGRVGILDHERAKAAGFDPVSETIETQSRSGYYPGAAKTTVRLTADYDSGRVLGGAIVGTDRAAVRINTLATALEADMTVDELERLDLAYAPPFSPVWDPILVAAKVLGGSVGR